MSFDPALYQLHLARERERLSLAGGGGLVVFNPSAHPRGAAGSGMGGKFIQAGASGAPVANVQRKVGANPDGQFGPQTKAAIEAFQRQHGLQVDGVVGRQTAAALLGGPAQAPGALTPAQAKILGLAIAKAAKKGRTAAASKAPKAKKGPKPPQQGVATPAGVPQLFQPS